MVLFEKYVPKNEREEKTMVLIVCNPEKSLEDRQ